jgi:large subunit ribosomal protein L18
MNSTVQDRVARRERRHLRIRKRVSGDSNRPRLAVYRSNKHIYGQIIDDIAGHTLVSIFDGQEVVKEFVSADKKGKTGLSYAAGKALAKVALDKGIKLIAFDRGGRLYHGRIKAFAEGAREGGLQF